MKGISSRHSHAQLIAFRIALHLHSLITVITSIMVQIARFSRTVLLLVALFALASLLAQPASAAPVPGNPYERLQPHKTMGQFLSKPLKTSPWSKIKK